MVKKWYTDFKCSCSNPNDAKCSGHPNSITVLVNTKNLHKLVLAHRKLKLHEIEEKFKISEGSVFTILQSCVQSGCAFAQLIKNNASTIQSIVYHFQHNKIVYHFQHNKKKFLHKYETMDETWINHFNLESNRPSAKWTELMKAVQSDRRCKHQLARFWPLYFGMHKVFCSSIYLRKEEHQ